MLGDKNHYMCIRDFRYIYIYVSDQYDIIDQTLLLVGNIVDTPECYIR